MSSLSRNQEFKYQYKTIAVANQYFCGYGPTLMVSVPDNLLDIKAIFMHAVLRFNPGVPSAMRKIIWAGGRYPGKIVGLSGNVPDPENGNMIKVDISAHPTTRVVDLKLDITHIKEDIIAALSEDTFSFDQPRIRLSLITDESDGFNVDGEVILWKIDFAYTTTGIQ